MSSWIDDLSLYVGRMHQFGRVDWLVYGVWISMMLGLAAALGGFVWVGHHHGAPLPADAYWVPLGALIFSGAIALDTIGHRTVYREELLQGEALVHHITIFLGISSSVVLCMGYAYPAAVYVPAACLTVLTFFYAAIDEAFHWRRYLANRSDPVEMWSHVFIFIGHAIMMLGWWRWFANGYVGVYETLAALSSR